MKLIGEIANLAGVSVPTLHYYDQLGILKPQARSYSGYRLYSGEDLLRLREILVWRRLGFPLADIAALLDDPSHDRREALSRQLAIARSQLSRFRSIAHGLELAVAAFDAERPLAEEQIFAGFTRSLGDEDGFAGFAQDLGEEEILAGLAQGLSENEVSEPVTDSPRVNISRVTSSRLATRSRQPERATPVRIVATDPVRIAENLLALGIVPVGTGGFLDRATGGSFCPWPDLVEGPIRDRVQSIGLYGTDKDLIAKARPDLIIDLLVPGGLTGTESYSAGRCRHDDLCEIAPTVSLGTPISAPGFLGRLKQLGTVLSVEDCIDPLVASWEARTVVVREHVSGQTVSALNAKAALIEDQEIDPDVSVGWSPNLTHEAQLFSTLGLELLPPPEGRWAHWGGAVHITARTLRYLSAPTLFLTLEDSAAPERGFERLVNAERLAGLPAVRSGRVFNLRWLNTRSGWFSAHWQLDVIARAFGICRLRTAGSGPPVHLAVAPSGKMTVASTTTDRLASLTGPRFSGIQLELSAGAVTDVDVGDAAAHVCAFPEAYCLATDDNQDARHLMHDGESALERVTRRRAA